MRMAEHEVGLASRGVAADRLGLRPLERLERGAGKPCAPPLLGPRKWVDSRKSGATESAGTNSRIVTRWFSAGPSSCSSSAAVKVTSSPATS